MKAAFPLPVDQITEVYRVFRLPVPNREKQTCTFAEFAEMAKKTKRLLAVNVDKGRDLYDVDGCIVESATVKFNGEEFKPVAAEDPDPAKVKATMEKLGLWGEGKHQLYYDALKSCFYSEIFHTAAFSN